MGRIATRLFNGKKLYLYAAYYYKVDAEKDAKKFRNKGYSVRITKNSGEPYKEGDRYYLWSRTTKSK